jgi:hypothetical protein
MNQEKVDRRNALAHYTGEAQLAAELSALRARVRDLGDWQGQAMAALVSALRILDREQTRECELAAARCRQAILDASGRGE